MSGDFCPLTAREFKITSSSFDNSRHLPDKSPRAGCLEIAEGSVLKRPHVSLRQLTFSNRAEFSEVIPEADLYIWTALETAENATPMNWTMLAAKPTATSSAILITEFVRRVGLFVARDLGGNAPRRQVVTW